MDIKESELHVEGDIVGRDKNVVTFVTNLPLSVRLAASGTSVAAFCGLILLVVTQWSVIASLFRPPEPMHGVFNIAIAPFGQLNADGSIATSADGLTLSKTLRTPIASALTEIDSGIVVQQTGTEPIRDEQEAMKVADQFNAQLVLYGQFTGTGDGRQVQPEFYIPVIKGADELVGPERLGTPIEFPQTNSAYYPTRDVDQRVAALTNFALGIEGLTLGTPEGQQQAVPFLLKARTALVTPTPPSTPATEALVSPLPLNTGAAVIDLFLGTTYAALGEDKPAESAYTAAAQEDPEYSRAFLGLGNIHFGRYATSYDVNELDAAKTYYEKARDATNKPESSYVTYKIHVSLGNTYLAEAESGQQQAYPQAAQEFQAVLADYNPANVDTTELAASSFCGLGIVYQRGYQDFQGAAGYYKQCLADAGRNKGLINLANAGLSVVEPNGQ